MHALTILQRHLAPLLTGIHARRLATLLDAVAATVSGPRLTLTDIGRRFGGEATLRNRIKKRRGSGLDLCLAACRTYSSK
jgi:hypothetical protein